MTDRSDRTDERAIRRNVLRELEQEGFSWFEEEVSVKPPDRERSFVVDAVIYRTGTDGEREPYVLMEVKRNPGSWAVDQAEPYARHLNAEYILITDGNRYRWYRTEDVGEELSSAPPAPAAESGGRRIDGPEPVDDIFHYFRRVLNWERGERFRLGMKALIIKYALERGRIDMDPRDPASVRNALSREDLANFLKEQRRELRQNWSSLWGYLKSFTFPSDFSWASFFSWYYEYRNRVRWGDESSVQNEVDRRLLPEAQMGFFRDLMLEIGTDPVACLEKNLATCTLGLLESDPERELTLFEEEWEIIHLLKALLWSQGSSCGANLEPVATDPVRGTIVSRYRERYNTALFIQPVPGRLDGYPDDFEMAEREDGAAIYTEGAVRMLKPGGMLITIVPTRLLAGKRNAYFRSYLRQHLIPAAIIEFKPRRTSGTCSCLIGTVSEDSDPPNEDVFMASPVEREEKGASFLEDIQSELFEHLHSFYS